MLLMFNLQGQVGWCSVPGETLFQSNYWAFLYFKLLLGTETCISGSPHTSQHYICGESSSAAFPVMFRCYDVPGNQVTMKLHLLPLT